MAVKLFLIPGSHPCAAALKAAELKGIQHETKRLPPALHAFYAKARFKDRTLPAMIVDGEKVQGTLQIIERFDQMVPEPRLFPVDPGQRARVEEAEQWGDTVIQDIGRRVIYGHMQKDFGVMENYLDYAQFQIPRPLRKPIGKFIVKLASIGTGATKKRVRRDLEQMPGYLDHVDGLIAEGVIGGEQPNAADLQILATIAVWMVHADLRAEIEGRPCGRAADKLYPDYVAIAGPGILPDEWLAPLRAATSATA